MADEVQPWVDLADDVLSTASNNAHSMSPDIGVNVKATVGVGYAILALVRAVQQAGESIYDVIDRRQL